MAPKPHQPIDTLLKAIAEHEQQRLDSHITKAMHALTRKAFVGNDSSEIDTRKTFLYDQLVDKVCDYLIIEFR